MSISRAAGSPTDKRVSILSSCNVNNVATENGYGRNIEELQ